MAFILIIDGGYHRRDIAKVLLHAFGSSEASRDECQITVSGCERWCQLWDFIGMDNLTGSDLLELSDVLGASQEQTAELFVKGKALKPFQDLPNIERFSFAYRK